MASSVKNAASSAAPILSDHAAQNLRTTSIGLSIWLLLWSILVARCLAPVNASPAADAIPAPPTAYKNLRRERDTSVRLSKSLSAPVARSAGSRFINRLQDTPCPIPTTVRTAPSCFHYPSREFSDYLLQASPSL